MAISYEAREKIGTLLYLIGIKYGASTDIAENLSLGYGKLDDNGFWQYPITVDPIKKIKIIPFWKYQSIYHSLFAIQIDSVTPFKRDIVEKNGKKMFTDHIENSQNIQFPKILRKEYKCLGKRK